MPFKIDACIRQKKSYDPYVSYYATLKAIKTSQLFASVYAVGHIKNQSLFETK